MTDAPWKLSDVPTEKPDGHDMWTKGIDFVGGGDDHWSKIEVHDSGPVEATHLARVIRDAMNKDFSR